MPSSHRCRRPSALWGGWAWPPAMAARPVLRPRRSAEPGLLQLPVDAVGELVEALVDRDLLGHHLLQRGCPFGGQVEEQRLRREVDLRARRRGLVLLEIAGIALGDPALELWIVPHHLAHRVDEVHLAGAEQVVLGAARPLDEGPGGILLLAEIVHAERP